MKINLDIIRQSTTHRIEFSVKNGLCDMSGFNLVTLDEIEELELELTNIVQKLYEYRHQQETK